MKEYRIVKASEGRSFIGYQTENDATIVLFDPVNTYPHAALKVKRPQDVSPYPVALDQYDGYWSWIPTSGDLEQKGYLECQVQYDRTDGTRFSRVYYLDVKGTLAPAEGDRPDFYQDFLTRSIEQANKASDSADAAKRSENVALEAASRASESANNAKTSERNAENDAHAAATNATRAETFASNANASATRAEESATNASTSANTASRSASSASSYANNARSSATTANSAASAAAASATAAGKTLEQIETRISGKLNKPTDNPAVGEVLKVKSVSGSSFLTEWAPEQGGGGSTVAVNPVQNEGVKIADITVDGVKKEIYAPDAEEYDDTEIRQEISQKYTKPEGGIPASDIAEGVIPAPYDDSKLKGDLTALKSLVGEDPASEETGGLILRLMEEGVSAWGLFANALMNFPSDEVGNEIAGKIRNINETLEYIINKKEANA